MWIVHCSCAKDVEKPEENKRDVHNCLVRDVLFDKGVMVEIMCIVVVVFCDQQKNIF